MSSVGGKRVPGAPVASASASSSTPPGSQFKIALPLVPRRPWSIEHLPEFNTFDLDTHSKAPPSKRAKKGTPQPPASSAHHQPQQPSSVLMSSPPPVRRGAGKTLPIRPPPLPDSLFSDDSMNATSDGDGSNNSFDTPTRQLRSSTERLKKNPQGIGAMSSVALPPETELTAFAFTPEELSRYVPKPVESPDEFRLAYKQYSGIYTIYSNIQTQLEKNKEDFEKLGKALKSAPSTAAREIVSARVRSLFTLRQHQVEQMRKQFQQLHEYLHELRNFIVDYLNLLLPGTWNNSANGSRPVRAAAAAASAALSSNS